jgi:hypothetical protein
MNLFFIFFLSVIGVATFSLFIHSQIQMHIKMIFLSGGVTLLTLMLLTFLFIDRYVIGLII